MPSKPMRPDSTRSMPGNHRPTHDSVEEGCCCTVQEYTLTVFCFCFLWTHLNTEVDLRVHSTSHAVLRWQVGPLQAREPAGAFCLHALFSMRGSAIWQAENRKPGASLILALFVSFRGPDFESGVSQVLACGVCRHSPSDRRRCYELAGCSWIFHRICCIQHVSLCCVF